MSFIQVKNGFNGWKKHKPKNLSLLRFDELQPNTVLEDAYIQGMIFAKWDVHKYKNSKLLKIVIQEVIGEGEPPKLGTEKLGVFIIGDLVQKWNAVGVGQYVCLSDVSVELGPNDGCRIALEENETRQPLIWFIKKDSSPTLDENASVKKAEPEKPSAAVRTYNYTLLNDLQAMSTVNVWGVVRFYRQPTRSRGTDFSTFISLTDPSLTGDDTRISCLLFAKEEKLLPNIASIGQIVRFHRLRVNVFNGRLQGRSGPGFAWLVYDPTGDSNEPIGQSSPSFTLGDVDNEKLNELREWVQSESCPTAILAARREVVVSSEAAPTAAVSVTPHPPQQDPIPSTSTSTAWQHLPEDSSPKRIPLPEKDEIPSVKYTNLSDLMHDSKVNVMGVITYIKPPSRTTKNDFLQVITIIDPSVSQDKKLKCLLFADRMEILLNDAIVGQLICFHNLNITKFGGAFQGQRGVGFSWALYDCLPSTPIKKIISSKDDFSLDTYAEKKMHDVRAWAEHNDLILYQRTQRLSDIEPNQYFDLICQIVATCELEANVCMLLRVWDGTEAIIPIYEADTTSAQLRIDSDPTLLEQAQGYITDVFVFDDHFPSAACLKPSDYVLLTNLHAMKHRPQNSAEKHAVIPRIELCLHGGTTYSRGLRLMDSSIDMIASALKERLYEKFKSREGSAEEEEEIDETDETSSRTESRKRSASDRLENSLLRDLDSSVSAKKARLIDSESRENSTKSTKNRSRSIVNGKVINDVPQVQNGNGSLSKSNFTASNETPRCLQESATVLIGHHHTKVTPLRDVIEHSVPHKFRVRVQLRGYEPKNPSTEELFCLHCTKCDYHMEQVHATRSATSQTVMNCPKCKAAKKSSEIEMQRKMRLTLYFVDYTGWIQAYLHGEQAEKFFSNKMKSESDCQEVIRCLETLCPSEETGGPPEDRPWMECCVLTYKSGGETYFQVFDTMLADEEECL